MTTKEILNVKCSSCNEGKLVCLDLIEDDYKVGCTNCDHTFWTHYTGYDNLLEAHEYNTQMCEDVRVLNENGHFVHRASKETRIKASEFDLANYTKGMKHIQTIESYENLHYYQNNGNFILITHNTVHKQFEICIYEPKQSSLPTLMKHFFNL